jgi:hypothetical protein
MAHYFVNRNVRRDDASDGVGRYWRKTETYGGWGAIGDTYDAVIPAGTAKTAKFRFQVNLSLLAALVGDSAAAVPPTLRLVDPIDYEARHRENINAGSETATITVQPWEAIAPWGMTELAIGPNLAAFLDDPLNLGRSLGLGLPFLHPEGSVGQTWIRPGTNAFHGGFDFRVVSESGNPRPLFDACAAADGVVLMLLSDSGKSGGVVLLHESSPGLGFATLYQHLNPSSVKLAVGETVQRGQRIGKVRAWGTNRRRTHMHFNLLVRAPVAAPGFDPASRLWFAIDPFGVYDEHDDSTYIPADRGGATHSIRGVERTIHWRGNPPIKAYSGELKTPYVGVRSLQMRARASGGSSSSPRETAQMLVWLAGDDNRYTLRIGAELDRPLEEEACNLLRDAQVYGRNVSLGYRFRGGRREVSAVWVK